MFWNLIGIFAGDAILNLLTGFGLNEVFVTPLKVVILIMEVFALIYLITGRGSELSQ